MRKIRATICVFLIISVLVTIFYGRNKIVEKPDLSAPQGYKYILNLWNIDIFEGGRGSRKQFLLDASIEFERQNPGVLVLASSRTEEGYYESIKNNVKPDILSFGTGIEVYNSAEITECAFTGGKIGDKTYAVPWCRGGYVLISNGKNKFDGNLKDLLVSKSDYTLPLLAFSMQGYTAENIVVKKPIDAYVDFVSGRFPFMLGTQRDVVRLNARGFTAEIIALTEYNDLYQYLSVVTEDENKREYAQKFVKFILSESVQAKLNKISMLSVFYKVQLESGLDKLQVDGKYLTISAFTAKEKIKEIEEESYLTAQGQENRLLNLKKLLV